MEAYFIRRKKLGKTSTEGIIGYSKHIKGQTLNPSDIPSDAICIRWGCTATVPSKNTFNKAEAIHLVTNKKEFRLVLDKLELCPRTWASLGDFDEDVFSDHIQKLIIRPSHHSQGKNITLLDLGAHTSFPHNLPEDYYVSELIDKAAEYRVFVAQGRVVWVANKIPADPKAIAWNVAQGGKFENVKWSNWDLRVLDVSVQAMGLSGLDFGGVDVIVDKNGNPYVLEINSAPSQTSPYRQQCVAKAFDYMIENGKEKIALGSTGKYLRYIHPAIEPKAIVS